MRYWCWVMGLIAVFLGEAAHASNACQMRQLGELSVTRDGRLSMIEAEIDGHPAQMIVDTGSDATLLFRRGAAELGLALRALNGFKMYGVGGGDEGATARVKRFKLGSLTASDMDLLVTGRGDMGGALGVLGIGFLLQADAEFDLPHDKIRFFKPVNCQGDDVVYWGGVFSTTPIVPTVGRRIEVIVLVDGKPIRALMDTGASASVLTTAAAAKLGITPRSAGVAADGQSRGLGSEKVATYVGVFPTFTFGDETINNAKLRVADLFHADTEVELNSHIPTPVSDQPQMLLGADFFRSHRVYVSRGQRKVYVAYVGGPVFETKETPSMAQGVAPSSGK